jgi:hypothetical protein
MNNLNNHFELIIMRDQIYRFETSNNIKFIHKKMKSYQWHLMIGLT